MLRIPIAHIHGGERSEGAIDESVRHAITKMASLHFPATESYRRRIIQMGESPERVFNFGAPGLDQIYGTPLMTRARTGTGTRPVAIRIRLRWSLIILPPRIAGSVDTQVVNLVAAIKASKLNAVFTMANADAEGARINTLFACPVRTNSRNI